MAFWKYENFKTNQLFIFNDYGFGRDEDRAQYIFLDNILYNDVTVIYAYLIHY